MSDAAGTTAPLSAAAARAQYRLGALLVAGTAVAWSSAGIITRAGTVDSWTTLFWRSIFAFLSVFLYVLWRDRGAAFDGVKRLGLVGWAVALSFAGSMISFILAIKMTAVANVIVFQAVAPFLAALLGWAWLGERISPRSMAAIAASALGVAIMVSDSLEKGRVMGDLLSFVMGATFALMIVFTRRKREISMTTAACIASIITGCVSAPFAELHISAWDTMLLAAFGIGQMGLGMIMFTAGVRLIPAADASLITQLEVLLAPFWVWLIYAEDPGPRVLLGGAVVLAAVVANTLMERRESAVK